MHSVEGHKTMKMKTIAKRFLENIYLLEAIGTIDYFRCPLKRVAWGPFNGQPVRSALFRDIIANTQPRAIVETGTYLGNTTERLAETGLPVYTIEADCYNFGFARARFWRRHNVTLLRGDSREILRRLLDGQLRALCSSPIFFYLDAHWNEDLPLAEELEIVFRRCPAAVVMIDDFQVPFDPGYGYDDYGPRKALIFCYIRPAVRNHRLRSFYPSALSADEGGTRRGCIVLAKDSVLISTLSSLPLLRTNEMSGAPWAGS
jgi:hypothetical protein